MYVLLFIFWFILNQKINLEITIFGIVITFFVGLLTNYLFDYSPKKEIRIMKKIPIFMTYIVLLVWEILKASFTMMKIIVDKRIPVEPTLVTFKTGIKTDIGNFILANSITLTPGTITVKVEKGEMTVHCLDASLLDTSDDSVFLKYIRKMEEE